jgi:hypothetical protein
VGKWAVEVIVEHRRTYYIEADTEEDAGHVWADMLVGEGTFTDDLTFEEVGDWESITSLPDDDDHFVTEDQVNQFRTHIEAYGMTATDTEIRAFLMRRQNAVGGSGAESPSIEKIYPHEGD